MGKVLSCAKMKKKCNIQEWSYMSLVDAFPRQWRDLLKSEMHCPNRRNIENKWFIYTQKIGDMDIPTYTLTNKLVYIHRSLAYSMPFRITKSTTLQHFKFKIHHGYLSTNSYLNKIKRIDTNLCEHCKETDEPEHSFASCQLTEGLWQLLSCFMNLSSAKILYGVSKTDKRFYR